MKISEVVLRVRAWEELAVRCSAGKSDKSCKLETSLRKNISWGSVERER